jgi:hypothetical protein
MGRVTELLEQMLERQVTERGIVVWYDPQKVYGTLAQNLELSNIHVLRFSEGFFRLRQQLEPYLEYVMDDGTLKPDADQPPALLIYVPMAREESSFALIEAETAGVVMEPGAARPDCNTLLGALVESIFGKIAPAKASHLARQADDGLLSLEELDRMVDDAGSSAAGTLQVIFGQSSAEEILLQFMASEALDQAITQKSALAELAGFIGDELGLEESGFDSPEALRSVLRRFVLLSDLLLQIQESDTPEALRRLPLPSKPAQRDMVRHVCNVWRNRIDFKGSFIDAADEIEQALRLTSVDLPLAQLHRAETFSSVERRWLDYAAMTFVRGSVTEALETAKTRVQFFWARERPAFHLEWKVIEAAAEVCLEAIRIKNELKKRKWPLDDMVQAYAGHAEPWMRLDRAARQLETRYARLDVVESGAAGLEKVIVQARLQYADGLNAMASAYSVASAEAEFGSGRFPPQTHVFKEAVSPLLAKKIKTAFFLVDALRFEMAAELNDGLDADYESRIQPILGQLPGITSVGMAALLPGAEKGLGAEKKAGGLGVDISSHALTSRQARLEWLQEQAGVPSVVYRLGEVVKLTPKRKKEIATARLVVITSQEIDRLGEEAGEEEETRVYIDEVLQKVRRAIRSLARAGIEQFIISADHGFHLIEGVDPGMSMDTPGGETLEMHPRVWIGHGGGSGDGYLRFKASDLELGGSLEFAFPRGMGTFKVKGGVGAYFHGGISPQEHILPLLTVKVSKKSAVAKTDMRLKLSIAKVKITNRLFTVTVDAEAEGLFPDVEKRVRLDVVSAKKQVGLAVAAAYDFDESTHEIRIKPGKPNVVTLMIHAAETPKAVTIQILDCESQLVLDALKDIPVELGI